MLLYPARGCQYNLAVFELRLEEGNERDGESESSRYLLSLVEVPLLGLWSELFCPCFSILL
jgi:hypothetical protein